MTIEPFTAKRGEILAMGAIVQQYSPSETRRAWRDPFSGIAEHVEICPAGVPEGGWQDLLAMHDLRGLDGKRAS